MICDRSKHMIYIKCNKIKHDTLYNLTYIIRYTLIPLPNNNRYVGLAKFTISWGPIINDSR